MKEKIKEVQDYFKSRLIIGDYAITDVSNGSFTGVRVDDTYDFNVWNDGLFSNSCFGFMIIPITTHEAEQIQAILCPQVLRIKKEKLLAEKVAALEELENEISKAV